MSSGWVRDESGMILVDSGLDCSKFPCFEKVNFYEKWLPFVCSREEKEFMCLGELFEIEVSETFRSVEVGLFCLDGTPCQIMF